MRTIIEKARRHRLQIIWGGLPLLWRTRPWANLYIPENTSGPFQWTLWWGPFIIHCFKR